MSPRTIRRLVIVVFLGGVAGMIVGSILDNNGMAITFGIVTAIAALCLMLVTSVAPAGSLRKRAGDRTSHAGEDDGRPQFDAEIAADVESRITDLVEAGADEQDVRKLVRRAIDLGRGADVPTAP